MINIFLQILYNAYKNILLMTQNFHSANFNWQLPPQRT